MKTVTHTNNDNQLNLENVKPRALSGLTELLENQLKVVYWAEKGLLQLMPKMMMHAIDEDLTESLENHLEETKKQIDRLEEIFNMMNVQAKAKRSDAMAGIIKEAQQLMKGTRKGVARDAAIIFSALKIEHYEIAIYGALRSLARTLGNDNITELLSESLAEEKRLKKDVMQIAETAIGKEALQADKEVLTYSQD